MRRLLLIIRAFEPLWQRLLVRLSGALKAFDNLSWKFRLPLDLGLLGLSGMMIIICGAWFYFSPRIPAADSLLEVELQAPLTIYTSDGVLIGEFGEQKRRPIEYDSLPPLLIQAFLAAEDDGFFEHSGIDIPALIRASLQLLLSGGEIRSGGGTITMQVARNYLLSRDRTFYRKFREIFLAIELEERFSKQKIMEFYINGVFFGNRAYGIVAAAKTYFGKKPDDLSLAEISLLVSLPKAPSRLNPFRAPALAKIRRNWVLGRMLLLDYIDEEQYRTARTTPIWLSVNVDAGGLDARYAAEVARSEVLDRFGPRMYREGYRVYTTLDSRLQQAAVESVQQGLEAHDQRHGWRAPVNLAELLDEATRERIAARDLTDFSNLDATLSGDTADPGEQDVLKVLERLSDFPTLGNRRPALVLLADAARFWALTGDARIEQVRWQPGALSWARKRWQPEDPDKLGYPPRSFEDLLATGDVVYLRYREEKPPELVQIPETESAFVSMDSRSGAIRSMVGGYDFQRSKFNRVTQALLQPGSVFKPFLYAAALENGNTPASIYDDAPVVFEDLQLEGIWRPHNSSGRFSGTTRLRDALVYSLNMVSIRLLDALGVDQLHEYLTRVFRFPAEQMQKDLSLALGSAQLTPLEIATAYATFSNGGYRIYPWLISHITDAQGRVVWRQVPVAVPGTPRHGEFGGGRDANLGLDGRPVLPGGQQDEADSLLDARIAYQISDILREVLSRGTASSAKEVLQRRDFAGKTGTTDEAQDAWFSGYNADRVIVVWVGYDQPKSLGGKEFGATVALPIWLDYIQQVSPLLPVSTQKRPPGLVAVRINPQTGRRAAATEFGSIFEIFRREKVPAGDLAGSTSSPEDIF